AALSKIFIVDLCINRKESITYNFRGPFCVCVILNNIVFYIARQFRVFEKQEMGVEDIGVARSEFFLCTVFDRSQLLPCHRYRRTEPEALTNNVSILNLCTVNVTRSIL